MNKQTLQDLKVLITRPHDQSVQLKEKLEQLGANVISFPTIVILPPLDLKPMQRSLDTIDQCDIAIFTSANSVFRTHETLQQKSISHLTTIAIGPGTRKAMDSYHLPVSVCPQENFTSEGLLDLPELNNIKGKNILLFTGAGGRQLLPKALGARGANVTTVITYRRQRPQVDISPLLLQWQNAGIDIILSSSRESLGNLFIMLGPKGAALLQRTPLVVVNRQMSLLADRLGCMGMISIAKNATDEALTETLCTWAKEHYHGSKK